MRLPMFTQATMTTATRTHMIMSMNRLTSTTVMIMTIIATIIQTSQSATPAATATRLIQK